ncbi:MAG: DUF885 domain-containing protein [Terriglobia bacterium]
MIRKSSRLETISPVPLLVAAVLLKAPCAGAASGQAATSAPSADQAFAALVDKYFDGFHHFRPASATRAGFHEFDAELPDYSRRVFEAEIARTKACLADLSRVPRTSLSKDNRFDSRLLEGSMRGHLLELTQLRPWERDPNYYNSTISQALFVLIQRDFAPLNERLRSLIAREQRVPEILRNARVNVSNPPAIYTTIAIRQVQSEIEFLKKDLPQAVAGAQDAGLVTRFQQVNQQAIQAYEDFLQYLKTDLAPRSHGTFAIGEANYRKKLLYDEMVDTPIAQLLSLGGRELRKTQADFRNTAALIDPAKPAAQVLEDLARDHPDAAHLLSDSQAVLDDLRQFVVSHRIVTIPSPENPRVVETPPFMRALTFASMDTPGAFETKSTQAFYNVTLPDPAWTEEQKEQHLRFSSRYAIPGTSIHEVFPGHYTQFLWVMKAPTKVRKLEGCSSNAEGWAHYAEQMMLEQGYGEGDPKLLLFQLHAALMRLCRYIVGLRMHTRGMTLEEGIAFFEKEGYLERVNAEREAMRGTADPTYLVYTLGKLQILKLREDYKKKVGDNFNLQEFHERFLSFGYPPVKLIREEMLGDDSPTL